jgi:molecular chaperone GrpE (heat shock protein)
MSIRLSCPCGYDLEANDEDAGQTLKCPVCEFDVMVPANDPPLENAQEAVIIEPNAPEETVGQEENLSPQEPDELGATGDSETLESESAPDSAFSRLEPLLVELNEKIDSLTQNVDFGTKFAEKKQEQIDKLYKENQEYKQGIHEKLKKSLILAVIEQIDAAQKTISHFGDREFSEENYRKLLANYGEIATDFQDKLEQSFDVIAFNCEENTPFDAKHQKSLKTIPTEDETKHKTISKSLRQGYEMTNADGTQTILRLEMVEVYIYQPSQS